MTGSHEVRGSNPLRSIELQRSIPAGVPPGYQKAELIRSRFRTNSNTHNPLWGAIAIQEATMPRQNSKEIEAKLKVFSISAHGDRNERLLWKFVGSEFPNYEKFWRRYIIPVTFRLSSDPS
jgi:hypothetical protein